GDDPRSSGMVAGDHHDADPGAVRARDRILRLAARRIDHADQAEETELVLDALVELLVLKRLARQRPKRDAERSQCLTCESLVGLRNLGAALGRERPCPLARPLLRA